MAKQKRNRFKGAARLPDTISLTLDYVTDPEDEPDEWDPNPTGKYIEATLHINNQASGYAVNITSLILHAFDINTKQHKPPFYPLTCGCGITGCAGFHAPVGIKFKKHNVQWHIPSEKENSAYTNAFNKTLYSFSKAEYLHLIAQLWGWLKQNQDVNVYGENSGEFIRIIKSAQSPVTKELFLQLESNQKKYLT